MNTSEALPLRINSHFTPDAFGTPPEYAQRARELGLPRLPIADLGTIVAWPKWRQAAESVSIPPLWGLDIDLKLTADSGHYPASIYATTKEGLNCLTRLAHSITRNGQILENKLRPNLFGTILIAPTQSYGLYRQLVDQQNLYLGLNRHDDWPKLKKQFPQAIPVIYDRVWRPRPAPYQVFFSFILKAKEFGITLPPAWMQPSAYRQYGPNRRAQSLLNQYVRDKGLPPNLTPNDPEGYLKSPAALAQLFFHIPKAALATWEINQRCEIDTLPQIELPRYPVPEGMSAHQLLRKLCQKGLSSRFQEITSEITDRLQYELRVIHNQDLVDNFLIVADVVKTANQLGIDLVGTGSATGSLVCYLMGITSVDPLSHNLLFERFINRHSPRTPDFDFDIDPSRLNQLIKTLYPHQEESSIYVYLISTFPTYGAKGALRMLLRQFGFMPSQINTLTDTVFQRQLVGRDVVPYADLAFKLSHLTKPYGRADTHPTQILFSGTKITTGYEVVDGQPPRVKVDKQTTNQNPHLDAVARYGRQQLRLLHEITGIDYHHLPRNDPHVLRMLFRGEVSGIDEIGTSWLQEVFYRYGQAANLDDISEFSLVLAYALSRPGASKSLDEFLSRIANSSDIYYSHPLINQILDETFGLVIFQDQAIRLAKEVANFSEYDLNILKDAVSKERDTHLMKTLEARFVSGAIGNGVDVREATELFSLISQLTGYAFVKGHALARITETVYPLAYFKYYYPDEFRRTLSQLSRKHR
jgi:DNA polymerase III alpha subunit